MRGYSLRSQLMQLKQTEATWKNTRKRKNTLPGLSSDWGGANFAPAVGIECVGIKNSWFFSGIYVVACNLSLRHFCCLVMGRKTKASSCNWNSFILCSVCSAPSLIRLLLKKIWIADSIEGDGHCFTFREFCCFLRASTMVSYLAS